MSLKGLFRDLVRKFLKKFQVWRCAQAKNGAFAGETRFDYSQPGARVRSRNDMGV
jgi:hypothetical protein